MRRRVAGAARLVRGTPENLRRTRLLPRRSLSLDDRSLRDAEGLCTTIERTDVEPLGRGTEHEEKEQEYEKEFRGKHAEGCAPGASTDVRRTSRFTSVGRRSRSENPGVTSSG